LYFIFGTLQLCNPVGREKAFSGSSCLDLETLKVIVLLFDIFRPFLEEMEPQRNKIRPVKELLFSTRKGIARHCNKDWTNSEAVKNHFSSLMPLWHTV
jgi:hypothetical protein